MDERRMGQGNRRRTVIPLHVRLFHAVVLCSLFAVTVYGASVTYHNDEALSCAVLLIVAFIIASNLHVVVLLELP
jgi:hypothetical protein